MTTYIMCRVCICAADLFTGPESVYRGPQPRSPRGQLAQVCCAGGKSECARITEFEIIGLDYISDCIPLVRNISEMQK